MKTLLTPVCVDSPLYFLFYLFSVQLISELMRHGISESCSTLMVLSGPIWPWKQFADQSLPELVLGADNEVLLCSSK